METKNELLPCPCCGGEPTLSIYPKDQPREASITCCYISLIVSINSARDFVKACKEEWNTRVYPEEVQAAIERDTTKRPDFIGDAFGVLVGKCPRCNYEVDHVCNKEICENCGQRLDWRE